MPPSERAAASPAPGEPPALLAPWLRMLWNRVPDLHAVPALREGDAGPAPWLSAAGLHLPAPPCSFAPEAAEGWWRAAAAHAVAHRVFSPQVFVRQHVPAITWALTGLLEDARTEALAARELPGLARLWRTQHRAAPEDGDGFEALLARLARALADPAYADPHPWVRKGRALFWADAAQQVLARPDAAAMRALASRLGNDIGQMRMGLNLRTYRPAPDYRDDNRWLWQVDDMQAAVPAPQPARGLGHAQAGGAASPPATQTSWRYPEWEARSAILRREWCTVHEAPALPTAGERAADAHPASAAALSRMLVRIARHRCARAAAAGDEIDLAAAVRMASLWRAGFARAEARPYLCPSPQPLRMAVLLLIDASASSAQVCDVSGGSALARQRAQAALLARAMQGAGWRVAIQAFCSEGRHRVQWRRVLDFGMPWEPQAAARLAGLQPGLSTRLGAALRHGARLLRDQPAQARWVVVLGDGEAHDVDVPHAGQLQADARAAVMAARRCGVRMACLRPSAWPEAPAIAAFGAAGTAAVESVDAACLGRALARLMASGR